MEEQFQPSNQGKSMRRVLISIALLCAATSAYASGTTTKTKAAQAGLCPTAQVTWNNGAVYCNGIVQKGLLGRATDNTGPSTGNAEFRCDVVSQQWVKVFGLCIQVSPN